LGRHTTWCTLSVESFEHLGKPAMSALNAIDPAGRAQEGVCDDRAPWRRSVGLCRANGRMYEESLCTLACANGRAFQPGVLCRWRSKGIWVLFSFALPVQHARLMSLHTPSRATHLLLSFEIQGHHHIKIPHRYTVGFLDVFMKHHEITSPDSLAPRQRCNRHGAHRTYLWHSLSYHGIAACMGPSSVLWLKQVRAGWRCWTLLDGVGRCPRKQMQQCVR
jgi:hypothetical protein